MVKKQKRKPSKQTVTQPQAGPPVITWPLPIDRAANLSKLLRSTPAPYDVVAPLIQDLEKRIQLALTMKGNPQ